METRYLFRRNKETIFFSFNCKNYRIAKSTGIKLNPKMWSDGKPKEVAATRYIRGVLSRYKYKIDNFILDILEKNEREPTKFELTNYIDEILGKNKTSSLLIDLLDEYLEFSSLSQTKSTMKKKKHHLKHFREFLKNREASELNSKIIKEYQRVVDRLELQKSTLNDYLKNAKAFLVWLYENEYTTTNFSIYLKKHTIKNKDVIALSLKEFRKLEEANLEPRLQRVIDLFLFSCYTGLRFEDTQVIKRENIKYDKLVLRVGKTKDLIRIPMIDEASELFVDKYDCKLPKISNQKANEYLKEAFKQLNLDRRVNISKDYLSVVEDTPEPLYDVITFHKSRKTFVTIALTQGISSDIVKKISGHKSDAVFQRYVNYADSILKEEMKKMSSKNRAKKEIKDVFDV